MELAEVSGESRAQGPKSRVLCLPGWNSFYFIISFLSFLKSALPWFSTFAWKPSSDSSLQHWPRPCPKAVKAQTKRNSGPLPQGSDRSALLFFMITFHREAAFFFLFSFLEIKNQYCTWTSSKIVACSWLVNVVRCFWSSSLVLEEFIPIKKKRECWEDSSDSSNAESAPSTHSLSHTPSLPPQASAALWKFQSMIMSVMRTLTRDSFWLGPRVLDANINVRFVSFHLILEQPEEDLLSPILQLGKLRPRELTRLSKTNTLDSTSALCGSKSVFSYHYCMLEHRTQLDTPLRKW